MSVSKNLCCVLIVLVLIPIMAVPASAMDENPFSSLYPTSGRGNQTTVLTAETWELIYDDFLNQSGFGVLLMCDLLFGQSTGRAFSWLDAAVEAYTQQFQFEHFSQILDDNANLVRMMDYSFASTIGPAVYNLTTFTDPEQRNSILNSDDDSIYPRTISTFHYADSGESSIRWPNNPGPAYTPARIHTGSVARLFPANTLWMVLDFAKPEREDFDIFWVIVMDGIGNTFCVAHKQRAMAYFDSVGLDMELTDDQALKVQLDDGQMLELGVVTEDDLVVSATGRCLDIWY